jgi:hypothetical protein
MRPRASDQVAEQAIVHLLVDGLTDIRATAYIRNPVSHTPVVAEEYHEHIQMIASICYYLPTAFRPSGWNARQTLQYVWSTSEPLHRQWIDETLEKHDISIGDVLGFEV